MLTKQDANNLHFDSRLPDRENTSRKCWWLEMINIKEQKVVGVSTLVSPVQKTWLTTKKRKCFPIRMRNELSTSLGFPNIIKSPFVFLVLGRLQPSNNKHRVNYGYLPENWTFGRALRNLNFVILGKINILDEWSSFQYCRTKATTIGLKDWKIEHAPDHFKILRAVFLPIKLLAFRFEM